MYRRGPLYQSHISIHAPAGGATLKVNKQQMQLVFQFTPLREGRHLNPLIEAGSGNFNSRPCGRGDWGPLAF